MGIAFGEPFVEDVCEVMQRVGICIGMDSVGLAADVKGDGLSRHARVD